MDERVEGKDERIMVLYAQLRNLKASHQNAARVSSAGGGGACRRQASAMPILYLCCLAWSK